MYRFFVFISMLIVSMCGFAQTEESVSPFKRNIDFRSSYAKINDLVHTKLDVKFDYEKSYLYGKAWITLKPHFYPTDSLTLDAKGMELKEVSLVKGASKVPLKYFYDSVMLNIRLDKTYKAPENYTIYIDYVSKPNELKVQGSAAITDAKGLYFVNPKGEDKDKPVQVWTQGETEANSVWFPTIDKPNQKTTEEIYMTVPAKYVTLSNGLLTSQKKNADGTRTDYWKMDLPHAPYLFFMGVGDFTIVKDNFKGKEVSYYVEKEYAAVARKIFGETPAMLGFFEKVTGVPYAWQKYSQMVGRDYVSGAMENTTATLHQESAYQNARELVDDNRWEGTIAHELFHHWFGDLVTAESWSNLTLNESFANYSEYLWSEFRHGKDAADHHNYEDMQGYLRSGSSKKELVRYYYGDKEEVFDAVSYNKGGRILHMLRNYTGDDAFFRALNKYLSDNKFKSAEAVQLRLAFEDITGKDLNWFWDQWYYGSGQPELNISYNYEGNTSQVIIEQTQKTGKVFTLPLAIDVYNNADKKRYNVWVSNKTDTFTFTAPVKPTLINVDADKTLLAQKKDNKSAENFLEQWKYAKNYLDRREALEYFSAKKMPQLAEGLGDKYEVLRDFTLAALEKDKSMLTPEILIKIEKLAAGDQSKMVKTSAIDLLSKQNNKKYISLFMKNVSDSSYSVSGAALEGLLALDSANAYASAKKYSTDAKGRLGNVISQVMLNNGDAADVDFISDYYKSSSPNQEKIQLSGEFANYLAKVKDAGKVRKGVDLIMTFRSLIPEEYRKFTNPVFKPPFDNLSKAQKDMGNNELADYISQLIK